MKNATNILIILIGTVYILISTKALLVPFVVALLIWYLIKDIRDFLTRNKFVKEKFPVWLQNVLVFAIIFGVLSFVGRLLTNSIQNFSSALPVYEANITALNTHLFEQYHFDVIKYIQRFSGNFDFSSLVQPVINSLSQLLSDGFMIVIYVIFLLLEESTFGIKHRLFFQERDKYLESKALLHEIDVSFGSYISIKTFTSFLTAILSYFVMLFLGVDTPTLWAFIIFFLNYIPSIGSLIATLFPSVIAILQTGSLLSGLWVLLGVGVIQVLVGNFLEPRMMGNSLNISPLVVILSLIAWGAIWGVLGMVLSVPIMVMLIIIFAKFEGTRKIAILLSENGRVK
jgi:predicted PurR-regulated permease PerM